MKAQTLAIFLLVLTVVSAAKKSAKQATNSTTTAPTNKKVAKTTTTTTTTPTTSTETPEPTIDWGKCPQLEPKESDRAAKAAVLESCLVTHPVPKNLTESSVETHQKQIAECALKKEKWFTKSGSYKFSKAEAEIKNKKLSRAVESQLVKEHKKCETEAKEAFPLRSALIDQVQLYQACMDFHITDTCMIRVTS